MDLIIKGTSGGSFVVMASYAPVPFSFYLQQEKKKPTKKAKTPNPVLLNCTTEYLKKGNVNAIFTILD